VYGGLIDRVHDLLLCGVDPCHVDLSMCLARLKDETGYSLVYGETESLIRAAFCPWIPSHHAFLYGPEFRACIASLCLVKVHIFDCLTLCVYSRLVLILGSSSHRFFILFSFRPICVALDALVVSALFHISPLRCG
jgi:hypothetical protein